MSNDVQEIEMFYWDASRFEAAMKAGIFNNEDRVQLIEGDILQFPESSEKHENVKVAITKVLEKKLGNKQVKVSNDITMQINDDSVVTPDIVITKGEDSPILVVEISDFTHELDQKDKMHLYAGKGIPQYLIINLKAGKYDLYKKPVGEIYLARSNVGFDKSLSLQVNEREIMITAQEFAV